LRAKFTNDSNFCVREVGHGSGVEERSLEIAVLQGGGRRWWETGSWFAWDHLLQELPLKKGILLS